MGLQMKPRRVKAGIGLLLVATAAAPLSLQAQPKGHSDRSVQTLIEYTWSTMPGQFRHPNGELIIIDRAKRKEVMVPLEKAREVVGVADRSARAQYCGMAQEQEANFQTMMRRERVNDQWSKPQLVFITLLHATTVAYLTGTMKFQFGADGEKDVEIVTRGPAWTEACTDDVRDKIRTRIMAYINEAPTTPAAKATLPDKRAEPASPGFQTK
jgi:hypothetical protein